MFNSNAIQVFNTGNGSGGVGGEVGQATQIANTVLLINADGSTNGSKAKQTAFIDLSGTATSITTLGSPSVIATQSPYATVGYAASFDGTASYYTTSLTGKAGGLNTGYTIEFWIKPRTINSGKCRILDTRQSDDGGGIDILFQAGQLEIGTANSWLFYGNATCNLVANTWSHFAVVRGTDNIWRIYWNGTYVSQFGFSNTLSSTSFRVGGLPNAFGSAYFDGYLSNIRVTNDIVYSANFTPSLTGLSGTNASILLFKDTASTVVDSSSNAFPIATVGSGSSIVNNAGNTSINLAVHGGALSLNGSSELLYQAPSPTFGTADFTIEFWQYKTSAHNGRMLHNRMLGGERLGTWSIKTGPTSLLFSEVISGEDTLGVSATSISIPQNQWNHIAVCRQSSVVKVYVNGAQVASKTYGINFADSGFPLYIGADTGESTYVVGYMSDINIIAGTAKYTSNFSVPTSPVSLDAGCKLLMQFKSISYDGIYDVTGLNNITPIGGNAQISTAVKKYGTGSIRFYGQPDYAIAPPSSNFAFTGDFSVECWAYPVTLNNTMNTILDLRADGTNSNNISIFATSTKIAVLFAGTEILTYSATISLNTWYHIAVVRVGSFIALRVNGTAISYAINSASMPGNKLLLGAHAIAETESFNGYIDDVRICKDASAYPVVDTNTTPFRYFRTTVLTNNDGSYAEMQELRYLVGSTAYPTVNMTSDTSPAPLVASASSQYSSVNGQWSAYTAFENQPYGTSYGWTSSIAVANEWLQIDLGAGNAIVPTGMRITANADAGRHPKTFRVEGSNTGLFTGEQKLLYVGSTTWPAAPMTQTFTF